jgi:uroporphyrinogen-III decarboxylase
MTMTGKERILAALSGEKPDRVPFVPNIHQWFYVNKYRGSLPEHVRQAQDPIDVLRDMGADIYSTHDGKVGTPVYPNCGHAIEFDGEVPPDKILTSFTSFDGGTVRREKIETPFGTLTHTWEYRPESGAPFESEHWWKDFESEYRAVRYWLEDTEVQLNAETWRQRLDRVGDDGIIPVILLPTPLKQFHWLAGQENATFFMIDHPKEMQELAQIHERNLLHFLEQVVDLDDAYVLEVSDNVDSLFYSPRLFRAFCMPALKTAAEIVHARGKYLFLHACGQLRALAPLFLEAEVDCVEGQAPPPLGDWHLNEARALSERLIVCGGMAAPEQELAGPEAAQKIDAYVRDLFASMGDKRRFLFGSSCNTSPMTPYENLLAFRDAAWTYGQL